MAVECLDMHGTKFYVKTAVLRFVDRRLTRPRRRWNFLCDAAATVEARWCSLFSLVVGGGGVSFHFIRGGGTLLEVRLNVGGGVRNSQLRADLYCAPSCLKRITIS